MLVVATLDGQARAYTITTDATTGEKSFAWAWTVPLPDAVQSSPTLWGSKVFFG